MPLPDPPNATPRRPSAAKHASPATPAGRRASAGVAPTPKSAPAAANGPAAAAAAAAGSPAARKKPEPSLLSDFLLGRPSPQRVAAQRASSGHQRRKTMALDAAGVREELRQEMRAAAVRKLQQPNGVRDRVKQWQKTNAAAVKKTGEPMLAADEAASEPTEVLVQVDAESVTEEDRVRIKMRKKPKRRKPKVDAAQEDQEEDYEDEEGSETGGSEDEEEAGAQETISDDPRLRGPPKKRIVSDEHWMKRRKGKSPPRAGQKAAKVEVSGGSPLPKDFLQKTAQNPTVHNKIKDWATRVEPEQPSPKTKTYNHRSGAKITVEEDGSTTASSLPAGDDGIRVKPLTPSKSSGADDGIRIKPIRKKEPPDDGIRVRPLSSGPIDDGIRIRAEPEASSADDSTSYSAPPRKASAARGIRQPSGRRGASSAPDGETSETPDTPSRKQGTSRRRQRKSSPTTVTQTDRTEDDDGTSAQGSAAESNLVSERPSTAPGSKSLADIPFGYSAFSELDLPIGADAHNSVKRPPTQRKPSFKAVPMVLKKVMSEGKKIIQEKVSEPPPRPVANQPRSIESWLNTTVDPFVESSKPPRKSVEKDWEKQSQKRPSTEAEELPQPVGGLEDQENADPEQPEDEAATPKTDKTTKPPSAGLKRSRATRSSSSPLKPGTRKGFKEALMDAFRGESAGHKLPPMVYPSGKHDEDVDPDSESDNYQHRRRSSGSNKRSPSPDPSSTVDSSQDDSSGTAPPRRRPPTNGFHELSTIVSEGSSAHESDGRSMVSETTVTQTTALTRSTDVSRRKSQKGGLKRRLTKHSDFVSVLSLPDIPGDDQLPARNKSGRSSRGLHRKSSKLGQATVKDLLQEFGEDEQFYQRELKTLVDGVVPVLLTQVVNGDPRSSVELFGTGTVGDGKGDVIAKSVVNMGIALERLRNHHKRAPLHDARQLLTWLDGVHSIYDSYLDAWRLDFQGLIVNLAPALERLDDTDSLVNAMPLNAEGDVLDVDGERVDVAHLLKRPLVRVKWLLKLVRGGHKLLGPEDTQALLDKYEALQEKARVRHREETARRTDEDATLTDTTRARDLRTLLPLEGVQVDPARQVNAKDSFSLDLIHSNGQRLECRVELIFRDNLQNPLDPGDVLVRETGTGGSSWLVFPPIPKAQVSARKGEEFGTLIVMVRGSHNGKQWHELINLSTDNDEQIMDWLDIFGTIPMPPLKEFQVTQRPSSSAGSPRGATMEADVPVGERKPLKLALNSPAKDDFPETLKPKTTPTRYRPRAGSIPTTPTSPSAPISPNGSPSRTPTQESYLRSAQQQPLPQSPEDERRTPNKLTKAPPNSTPYRDDGAPPPPIHRTLSPRQPPSLSPPAESAGRVKRRTSSPLKHEYHPSDVSSESSDCVTDNSASESESSGDELDEDEIPEPTPAISIKRPEILGTESVVSDSSLTPSNSASQGGLHNIPKQGADDSPRLTATVSYWSNKRGVWKEINPEACVIVIRPGLIEAYRPNAVQGNRLSAHIAPYGASDVGKEDADAGAPLPLIALDLTPVVMIRQSTLIDLEIRSPVRSYSLLNKIDSAIFRFHTKHEMDCRTLYTAVHHSRMNNAKFKALEEEARFRSFGQEQQSQQGGDGASSSSRRRSWFSRKNSYRASNRAPTSQSQSLASDQQSSSSVSASTFLKRLRGGNLSFNIDKSTLDKQSRPGSVAGGSASGGGGSGPGSLYTSSASSEGRSSGSSPLRSPSISINSGSGKTRSPLGTDHLRVRCHLQVAGQKWEDHGNCYLHITRPPPGMHQELRLYHGMEKRIIVTAIPKGSGADKNSKPPIVLDVVLGSGCFSRLGTRGICLNVWEDLRDAEGRVGVAPATGALAGRVKKWCFACNTAAEANWIYGLVAQEVVIG